MPLELRVIVRVMPSLYGTLGDCHCAETVASRCGTAIAIVATTTTTTARKVLRVYYNNFASVSEYKYNM